MYTYNQFSFCLFLLIFILLPVQIVSVCSNLCSGRGTCEQFDRCNCFTDAKGKELYSNYDCSNRVCPKGHAWAGTVAVKANDMHPLVECSNMGKCERNIGFCQCFEGFEGVACEKRSCPEQCNNNGICMSQKQMAEEVGRVYDTPWDAEKSYGCVCDLGFRGTDCMQIECPSGPDIMKGPGNESGRECSGRGLCKYELGFCDCFIGFYGTRCQHQSVQFNLK